MKLTVLGAVAVAGLMAASPTVAQANISQPVAEAPFAAPEGIARMEWPLPLAEPEQASFQVAQQKLRYDADGYIIGPDGKRIRPQIRVRWQIGVFR